MSTTPLLHETTTAGCLELAPTGAWTAAHAKALEELIKLAEPKTAVANSVTINLVGISALDTLGAWLLERLARNLELGGKRAQFAGLAPHHRALFEEMHRVNLHKPPLM